MGKAVVLGASSGIGRAFAERLIIEGWSVGTGSRRTELLEELRKAAPDRVFTESIDVRESGAEEALLGLIGKLGGMDLLFYALASGIRTRILILRLSSLPWRRTPWASRG